MVFILITVSALFAFLLLHFYEISIAWAASCVDNCRNAENNAYIDHGIVKSCFIWLFWDLNSKISAYLNYVIVTAASYFVSVSPNGAEQVWMKQYTAYRFEYF